MRTNDFLRIPAIVNKLMQTFAESCPLKASEVSDDEH